MFIVLLKNGESFGRTDFLMTKDEALDVLDQADQAGIEAAAVDLNKFFGEYETDFYDSIYWNTPVVMPKEEGE